MSTYSQTGYGSYAGAGYSYAGYGGGYSPSGGGYGSYAGYGSASPYASYAATNQYASYSPPSNLLNQLGLSRSGSGASPIQSLFSGTQAGYGSYGQAGYGGQGYAPAGAIPASTGVSTGMVLLVGAALVGAVSLARRPARR